MDRARKVCIWQIERKRERDIDKERKRRSLRERQRNRVTDEEIDKIKERY